MHRAAGLRSGGRGDGSVWTCVFADVVMQETIRLARRVTSPFRPHARRTVFQHLGGTLQQWPRHGRMHYLAAL